MTFTVGGCTVSVSFFFMAVIAVLLLKDKSGIASAGIAAAALHECAHLITMRALKCMPRRIRFTPFGIDIEKPCTIGRSYFKDAVISFSGPAANLTASGISYLMCGYRPYYFFAANMLLFILNILPIEPLDGGQALYALLCIKCRPDTAQKAVSVISFFILLPLAAFSFFILIRSGGNFSLFLVCCYLMAVLILKKGTYY